MDIHLKRPKHWKPGGIDSGSEWEVYDGKRKIGDIYETGQGWKYSNDITGRNNYRLWGGYETRRDAIANLLEGYETT